MKDPKTVSPLQLPSSDLDLNSSFPTIEIVRYLSFKVESTPEHPPPPSSTSALTSAGKNHTRQYVHGTPPTPLPPLPPPPPPPPRPLSSKKSGPWTPEAAQKNSSDRGSPSVYHYLLLEGGGEGGKRRSSSSRRSGRRNMSDTDHDGCCHIVPRTVSGKIASVFLVFIPTAAMIAVAVTWFYLSRQVR